MLPAMEGERRPPSTVPPPSSVLKGRLVDVFVPALVAGSTTALVRRLGTRATLDDPTQGRGASVAGIESMLIKLARTWTDGAVFTCLASTTGVDCDVNEGTLQIADAVMPIAVVAERRSMREIDVRLYYALPERTDARLVPPTFPTTSVDPRAPIAVELLDALAAGDGARALGTFEQDAQAVDVRGVVHDRASGGLAAWLATFESSHLVSIGTADDGRRCCLEIARRDGRPGRHAAALLVLVRGDSGLLREARAYGSAI
jgi:hypothetical protein